MIPVARAFSIQSLAGLLLSLQLGSSAQAASLDDLLTAVKLGDAREVVQLIQRGMDTNSTDQFGNTLLITAAREDQPKVVAELIRQRSVKLDARNGAGDTALMLASLRGYTEIVAQLLAAGASFEHPGWNPLLYAAFEGRLDIVEMLLKKGANPNALAPNSTTPLMFAARNGHKDVVARLLQNDVNLDWKNDQNETADTWAAKNRNTDIADLIQLERKARTVRGRQIRLEIN